MKVTLMLCAALVIGACQWMPFLDEPAGTQRPAPVRSAEIVLNPATGVILPASRAADLVKQCSRAAPQGVTAGWTPTADQIVRLEAGLSNLLAAQLLAKGEAAASVSPSDYDRQYAGIIVGGRQLIYVNGFSKSVAENAPMDWRAEPVMVCDGGWGFFGVEYDPSTDSFSGFAFNGPG